MACGKKENAQARQPPAPPVELATVTRQEVPLEVRAVGSVEPFHTVEVKSQVAGQLQRVHFREGQDVRKGDLLFLVDPRVVAGFRVIC